MGRKQSYRKLYYISGLEEIGIEIPALCYDPELEIVGACRMCLVEVEGNPNCVLHVLLQVSEGMVIHTETEKLLMQEEWYYSYFRQPSE